MEIIHHPFQFALAHLPVTDAIRASGTSSASRSAAFWMFSHHCRDNKPDRRAELHAGSPPDHQTVILADKRFDRQTTGGRVAIIDRSRIPLIAIFSVRGSA